MSVIEFPSNRIILRDTFEECKLQKIAAAQNDLKQSLADLKVALEALNSEILGSEFSNNNTW